MKTIKRYISFWSPVALWMGIIFFLSATPNLSIKHRNWDLILRKLAHTTEYCILVFFLWRAFKKTFSWNNTKIYLWIGNIALFYAVSDEFHQNFVPTRRGSLLDILFDAVGIGLALIIINTIVHIKEKSYCESSNS